MLAWLGENIGTIVLTLALVGAVVLIVWKLRKDKKQGKHTCGGNCAHCAMCETCRGKQNR